MHDLRGPAVDRRFRNQGSLIRFEQNGEQDRACVDGADKPRHHFGFEVEQNARRHRFVLAFQIIDARIAGGDIELMHAEQ